MMHSRDFFFCENLKWNAKWNNHTKAATTAAYLLNIQTAYIYFLWLFAVQIPNNNEGSNANEFISMQFKSISSCITFHTIRNHSYFLFLYLFACLHSSHLTLPIAMSCEFLSLEKTFDIEFNTIKKTEIYCFSSQRYYKMIFIF